MDPAIKKLAIVLAMALVVVLGLIFVTTGARGNDAQVATANSVQTAEKTAQTPDIQEADAKTLPAEVADASEVSKTNEAQIEDDAQEIEMYEGALAGLSEEEIANMALAEEEGAARGETTGTEDAID